MFENENRSMLMDMRLIKWTLTIATLVLLAAPFSYAQTVDQLLLADQCNIFHSSCSGEIDLSRCPRHRKIACFVEFSGSCFNPATLKILEIRRFKQFSGECVRSHSECWD